VKLTRRAVLASLSGAGVLLGFGPRADAAGAPPGAIDGATLRAYLDTLIPDDGADPGASRLGIDQPMLARAATARHYHDLLEGGCRWIDGEARGLGTEGFAALDEVHRERIVAAAAAAEPDSLPRRFFEATRADAFSRYYADPRAWAAIGYHGPPQPLGFPDYAETPGRAR
jgi:hypothetical protein